MKLLIRYFIAFKFICFSALQLDLIQASYQHHSTIFHDAQVDDFFWLEKKLTIFDLYHDVDMDSDVDQYDVWYDVDSIVRLDDDSSLQDACDEDEIIYDDDHIYGHLERSSILDDSDLQWIESFMQYVDRD